MSCLALNFPPPPWKGLAALLGAGVAIGWLSSPAAAAVSEETSFVFNTFSFLVHGSARGGQHDDSDRRAFAQEPGEGKSVFSGHGDVQDRDVERLFRLDDAAQCHAPVQGCHTEALLGEVFLQGIPDVLFVVHDDDVPVIVHIDLQ